MKTFLEHVAEDIIGKYGSDLSTTAVVFPNKRAALFMNEYLATKSKGPLWSPSYITISDLFRKHSPLMVGDRIKLVCDLYDSYVNITGTNESLDHFFGWGEVMLADFDDIDKSMANAEIVFRNISGIHELDGVSYLSNEQIEVLKKFFSHFTEEKDSELKRRFITIWNKLYDVYADFNERLLGQGLAYEGSLYRSVAENEVAGFEYDRYLFVGFNILHKVEQKLFDKLRDAGKARFYWDFDKYYMPDGFISSYISRYPNELDSKDPTIYSNFSGPKTISFVSATTENIQARYISSWLKEGKNRIQDGRKTAIVMCDESLLQTIVHSIPDEVGKINITTGYPLSQSPISTLLYSLIGMRTEGYINKSQTFRVRYVNNVLRHPYMRFITPRYREIYDTINQQKIYYPKQDVLCIDEGSAILFGNLEEGSDPNIPMLQWLLSITKRIAAGTYEGINAINPASHDPLFQESLFQTYKILKRLETLVLDEDLKVDTITLRRLLRQIIKSTGIPFHGEPAEGVQIMGLLETRNLDFDHVLMLSCNEGKMPKGVSSTSLIPFSIRKANGLSTPDRQSDIYSYYFHRLLQRASDITITYNTSTEGVMKGEMSRFMLQMLAESGHKIERRSLSSCLSMSYMLKEDIEKTDEIMEKLLDRFSSDRNDSATALLTPTAINTYGKCQLQFYFHYVEGIKEPDNEDDGTIDVAMFGNIFHNSAQRIYERLKEISGGYVGKEDLERLLSADSFIYGIIDEEFNRELYHDDSHLKVHPEYNGLQLINLNVIRTLIRQLIDIDIQMAPFSIVGLEADVSKPIKITTPDGLLLNTSIGGRIDRIDSVVDSDGQEGLRVVDYKTGGSAIEKSLSGVEAIFNRDKYNKVSGYYLQTLLYSSIVREDERLNPLKQKVSPALLFIQHSRQEGYDPVLKFGSDPITDIAPISGSYNSLLQSRIAEIFTKSVKFSRPQSDDPCKYCPFAVMCGRIVGT